MRNTDDKMKQKPKFKVGDKVKITNDFIFRPELKVGDVGVIKTVEPLLFPNYTIIFNKNGKTYTQSSGERHLDFANPEAENTNVEESASIKK